MTPGPKPSLELSDRDRYLLAQWIRRPPHVHGVRARGDRWNWNALARLGLAKLAIDARSRAWRTALGDDWIEETLARAEVEVRCRRAERQAARARADETPTERQRRLVEAEKHRRSRR